MSDTETAWAEGYAAARGMARCWGHPDQWEDETENPYSAKPVRLDLVRHFGHDEGKSCTPDCDGGEAK